ncbi:EamA family transporter [Solitalea sp. MAHUQ-68]|uniref:EamA family transporter n=1 Tax=Solitalea agri TaxID=2953739 RepID=A0A9X2F4R0_9SPHI|nr:EamA family transporter [Solitalea agri]MCO4292306.1 EamA family transporter [Solitalea agri]
MNNTHTKAYIALAIICVTWGTTFLATRVGIQSIPPILFGAMRQTLAALFFFTVFFMRGGVLPKWHDMRMQVVAGLLMIAFGNGVVAWGIKYVSSGLATIICSMMPIWVILINLVSNSGEKLNWKIGLGTLMGFTGLALIFRDHLTDLQNRDYLFGIIVIVFASISWTLGTMIAKKNFTEKVSPFLSSGIQTLSGGIMLFIFSPFVDSYEHLKFDQNGLMALAYLVILGSAVSYTCYSYALSKLPTSVVAMYAYINPVIAVIMGWLILDEKLNGVIGISAAIILGGLYLVNQGFKTQTKKEEPELVKPNVAQLEYE